MQCELHRQNIYPSTHLINDFNYSLLRTLFLASSVKSEKCNVAHNATKLGIAKKYLANCARARSCTGLANAKHAHDMAKCQDFIRLHLMDDAYLLPSTRTSIFARDMSENKNYPLLIVLRASPACSTSFRPSRHM